MTLNSLVIWSLALSQCLLTTVFFTNFFIVFQTSHEHCDLTPLHLLFRWPGALLPNHLLVMILYFTMVATEI